jgi:hypothetical protein
MRDALTELGFAGKGRVGMDLVVIAGESCK